ncbi:MAG: DivIVA domain-containing protein [Rhodococcus sp.]|nr:DivIVA domain-containing protein [Rhodococcus sp. (in: high G+C Gram-positive bacteria)]
MTLTPEDVRTVVFKSSTLLRHGYDMGEVDDFLDEVALTIEDLLKAQQTAKPNGQGAPGQGAPSQGAPGQGGPGMQGIMGPNGPMGPRLGPGQGAPGQGAPVQGAHSGQPVPNTPSGPRNPGQQPGGGRPPGPDQQRLIADLRGRVRDLENELAAARKATPAPSQNANAPAGDLLRRLDELERENTQLRKESEKDLVGISTRAVNLLTQAQRTADRTIADADKYARDLVMNARAQFQEILQRAQALSRVSGIDDENRVGGTTTAELEYVRNCAQLAQAQLQSLLATLPSEAPIPQRPEGLPRQ